MNLKATNVRKVNKEGILVSLLWKKPIGRVIERHLVSLGEEFTALDGRKFKILEELKLEEVKPR